MSNTTEHLNLTTWLATDVVNFKDINDNFQKIDDLCSCYEAGTTTSSYSGGVSGTATWRYKKYTDGTIDMSTKLEFTNIKCNGGSSAPYYSGTSTLNFPVSLSSVYDVQMHLASNTLGWVSNITGQSVIDKVLFRVLSLEKENTFIYKQIYINVRGVMA